MSIIDTGDFTIDINLISYLEKVDDDEKGYGLLIHLSDGKELDKWYGLVDSIQQDIGNYFYINYMDGTRTNPTTDTKEYIDAERKGGKPKRDTIYTLLFEHLKHRE